MPWKDKHAEKEYQRQYRIKNREKINLNSKKYRLENLEERKKYQRDYMKTYPEKNPEYRECHAKGQRKYISKHPNKTRSYHYKYMYNITIEDYDRIFEFQEGKCKICGIHQSELKKKLFVDHCHKTGKVRGLLCSKCNMGIGFFKDDVILLVKTIHYLMNPSEMPMCKISKELSDGIAEEIHQKT